LYRGEQLGYDDVWFAITYLINIEIAGISPPFGLSLFVMRGVAPKGTTMNDVYKAAIPFCLQPACNDIDNLYPSDCALVAPHSGSR
jgi:TRAP-type mannitol/chloroaromatic compound transport system permease large subunit